MKSAAVNWSRQFERRDVELPQMWWWRSEVDGGDQHSNWITTPLERVDRQVKPRGALRMGCSTENQALLVLG